MGNLELTTEEQMELEKRGFFIKELFGFTKYIGLFVFIVFIGFLFFIPWLLILGLLNKIFSFGISDNIVFSIPFFITITGLFVFSFLYIFIGKVFFLKNKTLSFGQIYDNTNKFLGLIRWINLLFRSQNQYSMFEIITFIGIFPTLVIFGVIFQSYFGASAFFYPFLFPIFIYLIRQLVEHFHPLYAFGNLGEKIQSLTPQIEVQSQLIRSKFRDNMNFSLLHSGFEKLSLTFASIISLVLKLENIEKKANKGNLFDSTKYINSLRSDIITPLTSLKSFLEKQKQELQISQQELTRVRVGGSDEGGNTELSSKRSESLLNEFDKNITALEEMILKMR